MKDFSRTLPYVRYTFLLTVLLFQEKVDTWQGFVREETISPNRLEYEGPRGQLGNHILLNVNSYEFNHSPDSCQLFGQSI